MMANREAETASGQLFLKGGFPAHAQDAVKERLR